MCGIAGYFGDEVIPYSRLSDCMAKMGRRGPDHSEAYYHRSESGKHCHLIHSRLNIIDNDARSNQPFRVGSKLVINNGELYNYVELRDKLSQTGRSFATPSDTEVMIRAIDHYGWLEALDLFEGMWAFALYDEADGSLLLCRDRFGEKPLYLFRQERGVFFGSEIKFIVALAGRQLQVNYNHLYRYMVNGYKSLYKFSETFFHDVSELSPGKALSLDRNGFEKELSYWKPAFEEDDSLTYNQAVQGVRQKLIDSVRLRLRSDFPIAFCMSGGIDSNSLISIARRILDYDVHGFTVHVADSRYDEDDLVEHSVSELKIRHSKVRVTTENFLANITELIRQHDSPVYTISYYLHWKLMENIKAHGYRVSVSGTGADELLTGYYDHHNLYLNHVRDSDLLNPAMDGWNRRIAPYVRNPYLKDPELYFESPDFRRHVFLDNDQFSKFMRSHWEEHFTEVNYCDSLLRNRMLNELFHESVPVILHEDDLNAMYFSIENRSPFLDRRLFEFCSRIPTKFLVRDGFAKVILRDAMEGIAPQRVLWNPRKVGFNAPVRSFLDTDDEPTRQWLLDDGPIFEHVDKKMIDNMLKNDHWPNSESKFLFYFVNAKLFLEEFDS